MESRKVFFVAHLHDQVVTVGGFKVFFYGKTPQKSNELIPKMVIFTGSRYRLSKAHHFGYPAVSFRERTPILWGNGPI